MKVLIACEESQTVAKAYPYRKDRYPTMEYDGYGERLEPEEDW